MGSKKDRNHVTAQSKQAGGPPWVLIGGLAVVATLGALTFYPSSAPEATAGPVAETTVAPVATASEAPALAEAAPAQQVTPSPRPAPDAPLPPLPVVPNLVPRPPEAITEAYTFAARNPDVLEYVPCFCGCETAGHKRNADCFVGSRNPDGSVQSWDTHGMACTVCIDVARDSMQLHRSGASVRDIRTAIESKYASRFPGQTPTPDPPR